MVLLTLAVALAASTDGDDLWPLFMLVFLFVLLCVALAVSLQGDGKHRDPFKGPKK